MMKKFKLDLKEERNKTRLTGDKHGGSTPMFEGQCARQVVWSAIPVETGDGGPCSRKDTKVIDVLETTEVPENSHAGIKDFSPQKAGRINSPTEVHLHQCTQHGQQTRGAGSQCSWKTMIRLPSQKHGGVTHATEALQWMAINSSEGIGKEGEAVG